MQGEGRWPSPSAAPHPQGGRKAHSAMQAPLARASLRSLVCGHVSWPRGARRAPPTPVNVCAYTVPLISSPLRGPCQVFSLLQGVFIKPHAALQSFPSPQAENPALWSHGEELRGTVQVGAACTGNRQQLPGSESRGPVHKEERRKSWQRGARGATKKCRSQCRHWSCGLASMLHPLGACAARNWKPGSIRQRMSCLTDSAQSWSSEIENSTSR